MIPYKLKLSSTRFGKINLLMVTINGNSLVIKSDSASARTSPRSLGFPQRALIRILAILSNYKINYDVGGSMITIFKNLSHFWSLRALKSGYKLQILGPKISPTTFSHGKNFGDVFFNVFR